MSLEFTGERVIPGQVDSSLWNEHLSRYRFALRFLGDKRVLDAGCGAGYGAREISQVASNITALDLSLDALAYGKDCYSAGNIHWVAATCEAFPFSSQSFDAVIAFEVIEHLRDQPAFLSEVKRVLAPGGILIVSTPNRAYYSEARAKSGPNLFHTTEFDYDEYLDILRAQYDNVEILTQDHTEGLFFRSPKNIRLGTEVASSQADPAQAYFFIALCSNSPLPEIESYLYLPETANLLLERGLHIARLEQELKLKDDWLQAARQEHQELVAQFRAQTAELRQSNKWAETSTELADHRGQRILELQAELKEKLSAYQTRLDELEAEFADQIRSAAESRLSLEAELSIRTEHMLSVSGELERQTNELANCVNLLHNAEDLVKERTEWALALQQQKEDAEQQIAAAQSSRWLRLGRKLGIGPEFRR